MITVIGDMVVDILIASESSNYATDTEATIQTRPGGQANNVAAWIHESGASCTLIGCVGNDLYGSFLQDELEQSGVNAEIEVLNEVETGKIAILVDATTGERTMYTAREANKHLSVEQIEAVRNTIAQSDCLYISGYSLFEEATYEAVCHAKAIARKHHVPIAFDPSSTYFLETYHERVRQFIDGVDFFFPNFDEGRFLTGNTEPDEIMKALRSFIKYPVLKMGREGSLLQANNQVLHVPALNVHATDTTGAGDSFIGAFLASFFENQDIQEAAVNATQTAAKAVTQIGGRP